MEKLLFEYNILIESEFEDAIKFFYKLITWVKSN